MGTECNRSFKGSKDVIYDMKRVVLFPFIVHYPITISCYRGSIPPKDFDQEGNWVKFTPDNIIL